MSKLTTTIAIAAMTLSGFALADDNENKEKFSFFDEVERKETGDDTIKKAGAFSMEGEKDKAIDDDSTDKPTVAG